MLLIAKSFMDHIRLSWTLNDSKIFRAKVSIKVTFESKHHGQSQGAKKVSSVSGRGEAVGLEERATVEEECSNVLNEGSPTPGLQANTICVAC